MREERTFGALGAVRLAKVEKWVMPPGHPPAFEHLVSIWLDGLAAGLALDRDAGPVFPAAAQAAVTLPAELYARLESPDVFTEYDEFPVLNDRDFEDLSIARVSELIRRVQPDSHPEVSAIAAAIWVDGGDRAAVHPGGRRSVAAGLTLRAGCDQLPAVFGWGPWIGV